MGNILASKPQLPVTANNAPVAHDQGSYCNCFLFNFLRNNNENSRQLPNILMNGERASFEMGGSGLENNSDGIVAVPNEMKREWSSTSLANYDNRTVLNQASINQILNEKVEPSSIQQDNVDSVTSQLSHLRSQLAKTRRENKRLIGELKALRGAYAQMQADQLHWKSQASLLLERAKIFETQLKHRDSEQLLTNSLSLQGEGENISTSRRPSLTPSKISFPTITRSSSNKALPSLVEMTESSKSLNVTLNTPSYVHASESNISLLQPRHPKRNCFCNSNVTSTWPKNISFFIIPFSADADAAVRNFLSDPNGMFRLRQEMALNRQNSSVFVLKNTAQCHSVAFFRLLIDKFNVHSKAVLWFATKNDSESKFSSDISDYIIEFKNEQDGDIVYRLPSSFVRQDYDGIFDEGDENHHSFSQILANVGQLTYAGYLMYHLNNFGNLHIHVPYFSHDSYYLSQLHLALRDPSMKSKRKLVILTCPDRIRLLSIMQHWLNGLRCSSSKNSACNFILMHSLQTTFNSERTAVIDALYHFTRILNDKLERQNLLFRHPSVSSVEKITGDFLRSLQTFATAKMGKFEHIVIVIHIADCDESVFDKRLAITTLFAALFRDNSLPKDCRVFIFAAGSVDEVENDEKVDTASQISGSSEQSAIQSSNIIKVASLDVSEYVAAANKLVDAYCESEHQNDDEFREHCVAWITNAEQKKNMSLTILDLKVRYICHMELVHKTSPHLLADADCLLELWKHIVVENCLGCENVAMVVELVSLLMVTEKGLRIENMFVLVPFLDVEFWFRFTTLLQCLGLISYGNSELDLAITCVKLNYHNDILTMIEQNGNLVGLSLEMLAHSRQRVIQFYHEMLSTATKDVSPHDVTDLLSMLLTTTKLNDIIEPSFIKSIQSALLTNALGIHLLYHSGNLPLVHSLQAETITVPNLSECQKMIMLSEIQLAPGTHRAHLLMSLGAVAADFGFTNLSISLLADALDTIRADNDGDDSSMSFWATSVLAHIMVANIAAENATSATNNGYRSTAERNVSSASKIIARLNNYRKKATSDDDDFDFVKAMALDIFSSHTTLISLQLKQMANGNNKKQ